MAWLDERTKTQDATEIGKALFLASEDERKAAVQEGFNLLHKLLVEANNNSGEAFFEAASDGIFMGTYLIGAQAEASIGPDAWPIAFMDNATVPGLSLNETLNALLHDVPKETVSRNEVEAVVRAYTTAAWGESGSEVAKRRGFDGLMVSVLPQQAAIQYCIGILWGYALRGLIKRLAFDRSLGTVPEPIEAKHKSLERALAWDETKTKDDAATDTAKKEPSRLTLLSYATEFFGHRDWIGLCRPSDSAIDLLEEELEEAIQGMAVLTSAMAEDDDIEVMTLPIDGNDASDDDGGDIDSEDVMDDSIVLEQKDWEHFQRRATALGSLLADAEALVDSEAGPLPRGRKLWVEKLIRSGALSGVRPDQTAMVASGIASPIQRLATAIKHRVVGSKMKEARRGLESLFFLSAEKAAAATASAAKKKESD
eukprot:TRINITY_DN13640_c0_g1_i1.p1 TRINITY_DN13640_c0_g1~~TRINITY_DN13640_c0_g1_i1.p1  ORF type:complete len:501 (+),score=102.52 TRINITY_DN13640_c0_g1_i1:226-1503(+)